MKVALVYDWVNKFGGAERVLLALNKLWPKAPLYTSVYNLKRAPWSKNFRVIPSFAQKFPLAKKKHEIYPWLMPFVFENFNFDKFDVVISVASADAKSIITMPKTLHICYCLTPTRYLWSSSKHYFYNTKYGVFNPLARLLMKSMFLKLRQWDLVSAQRPDYYAAISKTVQKRIKKYYNRDSYLIYPSVDTEKFHQPPTTNHQPPTTNYFLVVSRLVSYKRLDIIIKAFNKLALPLKIIGDGSERKYLEKIAKPNVEFVGKNLTDKQLISYYQNCSALVFSGVEDFGLVSLEAQACGKPVIAYKIGGIGETVINGRTGILFSPQSSEALIGAVKSFKADRFKAEYCRQNAEKFSQYLFEKKFKNLVEEKWKKHQRQIPK